MNKLIDRCQWMRSTELLSAGALALSLISCDAEDIKVYKVAKETSAMPQHAMSMAQLGGNASARPQLKWTTPKGWEELAANEMRVASFKIKGDGGKQADMSAVPLAGTAGGDLPNVNRWRGEVGLPNATEAELPKLAEKVSVGGLEADVYDQAGVNSGSGDKERILAAILHRDDTAWFFKMKGDDELVAAQKKNFVEFLKSLSFGPSQSVASLPPDHPPMGGTLPADHPPMGGAMAGMQAQQDNAGLPQWNVPETWKKEPPTQMLLAKFSATKDGARADITVSSFPGDVGGLVANVNRWRRQVGLDALDAAGVAAAVKDVSVGSETGKLLDVEGTDARSGKPARLVGVALPHGDQTWFFKMLGDAKVVADQKDAFVKFVQSVKF